MDGAQEEALVAALRAGDDAAYEKLVREQTGRMLAVARRFLRNEDDARDAVQDAFLSAFNAIGNFEGGARISTWLHRIVVNAALMKLRTRRRKPEESIEDLLPRWLEDGHAASPAAAWSAEKRLQRDQLRALVQESIDRLPDTYREVLMLRDIEELDTQETAEMLGISNNAVKTRLHRARQALREVLDPALREAG
jgi:RNA polymerase sigma-70 factor (ECF subfamily)